MKLDCPYATKYNEFNQVHLKNLNKMVNLCSYEIGPSGYVTP